MSQTINIEGLSSAAVLIWLWSHARTPHIADVLCGPQTLSFNEVSPFLLSEMQRQGFPDRSRALFIDYIKGRPLKITFYADSTIDGALFERDNLAGTEVTVAQLIEQLRGRGGVP